MSLPDYYKVLSMYLTLSLPYSSLTYTPLHSQNRHLPHRHARPSLALSPFACSLSNSLSPDKHKQDQIKTAYKRASLLCHPDRIPQATPGSDLKRKQATVKFQAVADAYYTLSDSGELYTPLSLSLSPARVKRADGGSPAPSRSSNRL